MTAAVGGEQINETHFISTTAFYILFAICSVLTVYHFWMQTRRYVKLGNKIPGPFPIPIVGNAWEAILVPPSKLVSTVLRRTKHFEKLFRIWLGPKLYVFLFDPEDIEIILNSHIHIDKSDEYKLFEPWLGEGLLISKGDKWKTHRKMIAPTFHSSILKTFIPVFNKNSKNIVRRLKKEIGNTFDVHDYMSAITVEILLETAMGVQKSEEDEAGFDYAMAVMKMCNILHQRHYKFWLRPDIVFKWTQMAIDQSNLLNIIHALTRKVIRRKKEEYFNRKIKGETSIYHEVIKQKNYEVDKGFADSIQKEKVNGYNNGTAIRDDLDENDENDVGEKKRLAFLDFMIEAGEEGKKLSDEEIKEEVDTIMFEGHDTTAAASSFVLSLLGIHQDIQEKVYQELYEIFQDSKRECTFADTLEMKYLERVILESLRLYPPVPAIARVVNEDVKLASGNYTIPAGATVVIGTLRLHRQPHIYPNPEKFDPDNFLPERCLERHHYSYIPFSAGPRSCVGRKYAMLKLKVLLSTTLRNFKIRSNVKEKDFVLQGDIILKRAEGFTLQIEERI